MPFSIARINGSFVSMASACTSVRVVNSRPCSMVRRRSCRKSSPKDGRTCPSTRHQSETPSLDNRHARVCQRAPPAASHETHQQQTTGKKIHMKKKRKKKKRHQDTDAAATFLRSGLALSSS